MEGNRTLMSHICLLSKTDTRALFSGATIFAAGAGNCGGGGDPEELFNTFVGQLADLPNDTRVYPGHDYIANNLGFTVDREPDNERASALFNGNAIGRRLIVVSTRDAPIRWNSRLGRHSSAGDKQHASARGKSVLYIFQNVLVIGIFVWPCHFGSIRFVRLITFRFSKQIVG